MREGSAARRLIVNADDFGLTDGREPRHPARPSRGPGDQHDRPGEPAGPAGAGRRRPSASPGLGLGLHFNLTLGRPVSPPETVASLVDAEGRFGRDLAVLQERARPDEVRRECEAQIEAFTRRFGRGPTHLDSHHHAHRRAPRDGRGRRRGPGRASAPPQPGRGVPRRPAPPRHRHDGLVRRRRATPSPTGRPSACSTSSPRCRSGSPSSCATRASSTRPRLQPLRAPARGRAGGVLRSARRGRPSSAWTSGSATSARSTRPDEGVGHRDPARRAARRHEDLPGGRRRAGRSSSAWTRRSGAESCAS